MPITQAVTPLPMGQTPYEFAQYLRQVRSAYSRLVGYTYHLEMAARLIEELAGYPASTDPINLALPPDPAPITGVVGPVSRGEKLALAGYAEQEARIAAGKAPISAAEPAPAPAPIARRAVTAKPPTPAPSGFFS